MRVNLLFKFPQFFLYSYPQFNGVAVFLHHKHQQLIDFTACFLQYFTQSCCPTELAKQTVSRTKHNIKT